MPISVDDLISLINEQTSRLKGVGDSVAAVRKSALFDLRDVLRETGFPTDRSQRLERSLIPFVFQEANWDDLDWTDRTAPLGHLSGILAIDTAVQSSGRERNELTDAEYDEYVALGFAAIDYRQQLPLRETLPGTEATLEQIILFARSADPTELFKVRWDEEYQANVRALWDNCVQTFKAGAAASARPDELLMCLTYDVTLEPSLGVPEPHKLPFLRWLVEGMRRESGAHGASGAGPEGDLPAR